MNPLLVALAIALAIPASDGAPSGPPAKFTFRFAPSDGATWTETERQTKLQTVANGAKRVVVQESKTRVTAHRIKGGWRLDHRVLKIKLRRDGRDESRVLSGLEGVEVALITDAKGDLKRVEGLENLVKAMGKELPALVAVALESLTDTKTFEAQIRSEWEDRVSYFAGVEAEVGQYWVGTGKFQSVHGPVEYHAVTKVADRLPYQGASCVRLRFASHTDPAALARISPEAAEKASANAKPPAVRQVDFASEGERILDPRTLMYRRERVFKTTRIWVDVPLLGRQQLLNEEQTETSWAYD